MVLERVPLEEAQYPLEVPKTYQPNGRRLEYYAPQAPARWPHRLAPPELW